MNPLLTAEDVAVKWQVSVEYVWDQVDRLEDPLPFVPLGRGNPTRGAKGQRGQLRFRLASVEAWEARAERVFPPVPKAEPILASVARDGIVHGGRRGRSKMDAPEPKPPRQKFLPECAPLKPKPPEPKEVKPPPPPRVDSFGSRKQELLRSSGSEPEE